MATQDTLTPQERQALEDALGDLGLAGSFLGLIEQAVRQQWSINEFFQAIMKTEKFRKMYPGLVNQDGGIADFFGTQDLLQAVQAYNNMQTSYEEAVKRVDPGIGISRKRVGMLIRGGVSAEEFETRLGAISAVRANPGLLDAYNAQLKLAGKKPLDEIGWFRFMARSADANFYDIYEAALLSSSGLDIDPETGRALAGELGPAVGQSYSSPVDIADLVAGIFSVRSSIGPELAQHGITDADLVRARAGIDPGGLIEQKIRQLQMQRELMGQPIGGTLGRRTRAGGFSVNPQDDDYGVD